jgi:hypothetical protein
VKPTLQSLEEKNILEKEMKRRKELLERRNHDSLVAPYLSAVWGEF